MNKEINLNEDVEAVRVAKVGETILLSGTIISARDAAHQRIEELFNSKTGIPVSLENMLIYYLGPTPTREGKIIGSCGPTSSYRMDNFIETTYKLGSIGSIGKGERSVFVTGLVKKYRAPYLVTFGGASAYLAGCVTRSKLIAFPDLGTEAIYQLELSRFPVIVAIDIYGNTI